RDAGIAVGLELFYRTDMCRQHLVRGLIQVKARLLRRMYGPHYPRVGVVFPNERGGHVHGHVLAIQVEYRLCFGPSDGLGAGRYALSRQVAVTVPKTEFLEFRPGIISYFARAIGSAFERCIVNYHYHPIRREPR